MLLALFGAVRLARNRNIGAEYRLLLLIWIVGTLLVTLLITPLPWARYYLSLQPALIAIASYALVTLAAALRRIHRA